MYLKGNLSAQCSHYGMDISLRYEIWASEKCTECLENTYGLFLCIRKEMKSSVCFPQAGSCSALSQFYWNHDHTVHVASLRLMHHKKLYRLKNI